MKDKPIFLDEPVGKKRKNFLSDPWFWFFVAAALLGTKGVAEYRDRDVKPYKNVDAQQTQKSTQNLLYKRGDPTIGALYSASYGGVTYNLMKIEGSEIKNPLDIIQKMFEEHDPNNQGRLSPEDLLKRLQLFALVNSSLDLERLIEGYHAIPQKPGVQPTIKIDDKKDYFVPIEARLLDYK